MTRIRSRLVPVKRGASQTPSPTFWAPFTDSGSGVLNTTLSRGSGSITWTRAGATGTTILSTGLVSSTIAANTGRSYYDPTTLQYLGGVIEEARTNRCLHNGDKSNAVWAKTTCTISAATGADGTSRNVRVTATAGNATILQSITDASAARIYSAMVKRVTGTGNIDITIDGGATWTTISGSINSSTFVTVSRAQTLANPQVGFRIVTNGDVVDIDFDQEETGTFSTTRIPTGAASVTRAADVPTVPTSGNLISASGSIFARVTGFSRSDNVTANMINVGANQQILYGLTPSSNLVRMFDGTTITSGANTWADGVTDRLGSTWSTATGTAVYANGAQIATSGTASAFAFGANINIGDASGGAATALNGCIRDIRGWQRPLSASQFASIR